MKKLLKLLRPWAWDITGPKSNMLGAICFWMDNCKGKAATIHIFPRASVQWGLRKEIEEIEGKSYNQYSFGLGRLILVCWSW